MRGECFICGRKDQPLTGRWYVYDSGEQHQEMVCPACVADHDRVSKEES